MGDNSNEERLPLKAVIISFRGGKKERARPSPYRGRNHDSFRFVTKAPASTRRWYRTLAVTAYCAALGDAALSGFGKGGSSSNSPMMTSLAASCPAWSA